MNKEVNSQKVFHISGPVGWLVDWFFVWWYINLLEEQLW